MCLKKSSLFVSLLMLTLFLSGCGGYYFPHVYTGPAKSIYMPDWKNRTNELGLDSKIYQSLSRWFQKSSSISTTKQKNQADLILAGEIVSIDLPSVAYGANYRTKAIKVTLVVRYILKDRKSGKILWEVGKDTWTEATSSGGGSAIDIDNEAAALKQIIDDLSEKIYLGTLRRLRQQKN